MSASIDVKVLNTANFELLAGALGFDSTKLSYAAAVGRDKATTLFLAERDDPETVTDQGLGPNVAVTLRSSDCGECGSNKHWVQVVIGGDEVWRCLSC